MAATEALDRILRRLNSPVWLYKNLVDQFRPPEANLGLTMLMCKLMRVEEVVGTIGNDEVEVAGDWQERVVILWAKYAHLEAEYWIGDGANADDDGRGDDGRDDGECFRDNFAGPNAKPLFPAKSASHSFSESFSSSSQNAAKSPVFTEPILKRIMPSSYPVYKPVPRNITPAQEEDNYPSDNSDRRLSKTSLLHRMQDSFYDLQIDSLLDIDGLAAMLRLVSRAGKLLIPYEHDARLKWDIFGYAFDKLPFELQGKYRDEFGPKSKSLPNLFHWLRYQISHIYMNARKLGDLDGDSAESLNSSSLNEMGHQILCFRCFQFGHSKYHCTNNELFLNKDGVTFDGQSSSHPTTRPSYFNNYNCKDN